MKRFEVVAKGVEPLGVEGDVVVEVVVEVEHLCVCCISVPSSKHLVVELWSYGCCNFAILPVGGINLVHT